MRGVPWRLWVGVIAVGVGAAAALPACAAWPSGSVPAASQDGVEEAKRLEGEVLQLSAQGKYAEALPLAERALLLREKALGPEHLDVAAALDTLALLYQEKGDPGRAEPLYQRALAIWEKALGPAHPNVAAALNNLAELYRNKGEHARAEPLYQRALAIWEKALGPDHATVGACVSNLAALYWDKGDHARAEPLLLRALSIREKALGPAHPDVAVALSNLAKLYQARGDHARAEPLLLRAEAIWEEALGPAHPTVAVALSNLAALYQARGEYARAEPLYLRSLALREKALGQNHPDVAQSLNDLAMLCQARGEYARVEPLLRRALAILEKALGQGHPLVATALNNLAALYQARGEYARAEPLYQRSRAILEKALEQGHPNIGTALNNMAELYREKGDYGRAERLLQSALSLREKALGPDHIDVAQSLNNLAALYRAKGDYGRAEPLLQRARAIWEKALGPDHPSVGTALSNLAALYQARGEFGRAEPLCNRALSIREKALGPFHPDVAQSLNSLAVLYQARGEFGRAEPLYQRALSIREKALGPFHPDIARSLHNLTWLYAAQGRIDEAVLAAQRGADLQDRNAAAVLATGSEEQKSLYMAGLTADTYTALSLHVQLAPTDPAAARLAVTTLLRRKGLVLDAMADSLAALRRTLGPLDQTLLDGLAAVYTQLAAQVSRVPEGARLARYRKDLAALEQERQTLEAELSHRSAAFRAEQRLVTLSDVQEALPESAALVEIALYVPLHPRAEGVGLSLGAPRYVAYVVRRVGEPRFADLGEAAALDGAVDTLRKALGDPDLTHDPRPAARALDALLMQPIRALLGEARWVFVSPDGPLSLVPFSALVDEQGHYLVERYLFSYLTNSRDLLRFQVERAAPRQAPLVLADPAFEDTLAPAGPDATERGVRSIDMNLKVLPIGNTREEARAIGQLFPDAQVLLGAQATEGAVKAAHGPRLLHLATHGFYLPEMPLPPALLAGPEGEPTPAERAAIAERENPLLRSGVALAGFNRRKSGDEDGVLTAMEAAGLDLYGTQLVVLSTCESGLGKASTGEGVYGLRRTLSMAGAETQVMSLWQVDTGRTRELMLAYYKRLQAAGGRSEAMRQVQLAMLADPATAHPNLWASFVVSGDFRPLSVEAQAANAGRVAPGPRGCACGLAGGDGSSPDAWLSFALGVAVATRRARPRRPLARTRSRARPAPPCPPRAGAPRRSAVESRPRPRSSPCRRSPHNAGF